MIVNNEFSNLLNYPVRYISAKVELFEGSTLADTYNQYYALKELTIERVAEEGKFFGFGICQKMNLHLVDKDRYIHITTADSLKPYFSVGSMDFISTFPLFHVSEVHRDENTNELSVTAYDAIYEAANHPVAELELTAPYTIADFANACCTLLGVGLQVAADAAESFQLSFDTGANFEGTETLREALNAIAEATQTIYYLNSNNELVFKRLDIAGEAVLEIGKANYISLDSGENRRLATITHATELGDNVSVSTSAIGSTQYVRDNPFWELREDIDTLLNNALAAVGGMTINQFSCSWRGNPLIEIGDKINLVTKDNNIVSSYVLDDVIFYDGSLSQSTQWNYTENEGETESNPVSLGDALKQTFARVDKANKQIDLVVSEVSASNEAITALQLNTESITASVQTISQATNEALEGLSGDVATLTNRVDASVTSEDVTLQISNALANGAEKVTTTTGFTFNEEGLTVSKSGSEMSTTITENGMTVYRDSESVLIADHEGVKAEDLHATTYLIIGTNSRFEDYGTDRTGCFWIGG